MATPNPPYSEMILAAIAALDEKEGSSDEAISKHIESTYGELPEDHSSLLATHLAAMTDSGELLVLKDNYLRPTGTAGSPAPLKRGRGRPPKPKPEIPADYVPPPRRPRGRPPKSKDPLAEAVAKAASGFRPPKKAKAAAPAPAPAEPSPGGSVKRGRGRPPKVKPAAADVAA